jgi:hypothetical protein
MDDNVIIIIYYRGKARRYVFTTVDSAKRFIKEFLKAYPDAMVNSRS